MDALELYNWAYEETGSDVAAAELVEKVLADEEGENDVQS